MKLNEETYLFPHLQPGMLPAQQRAVIQQLTKTINKYMKRIAQELGLSKPVTSYYARHSFATVLRNAGATTEFISEALGHSNIKTTQSYLAGFDERLIHQATDALIAFE
jgi:site-specific recombinase XerD